MYISIPALTLCVLSSLHSVSGQAAGGGVVTATLGATQMATTSNVPSLFTLNGATSATNIMFTQTFASTALGSWALGATPLAGSIGLGSIQGTVGVIKSKTKRGLDAIETAAPLPGSF